MRIAEWKWKVESPIRNPKSAIRNPQLLAHEGHRHIAHNLKRRS